MSVVAVDDVGRVIHPVLCEGQVEGGTLQAVGYATIEEIKLRDGRYLNDRLQTYIIPTALDAPRIDTILVEAPFDDAPHGAKGVGELPMDVGAPAVIAAIHDATGAWIHDLPATPERILAALAGIDPPGPPGSRRVRPGADGDPAAMTYRLTVNGERVGGRRAGDAPAARRPARGPRPDRDEGGLRRGRVRRLHGARRWRGRRQLPRPGLPGRRTVVRTVEGLPAGRPVDPGRPGATLQRAFLETGGAQCGICTPGMLMAAEAFLAAGRSRPTARSARPSPATCAAAPATRRSSTRSRSPRSAAARARADRGTTAMPVEPPGRLPVARWPRRTPSSPAAPHRPVAGGTDLLVQLTGEIGPAPERVIDLWRVEELRGIRVRDGALELGALTTYTRDPPLGRCAPSTRRRWSRRRRRSARPRSRTAARSAAT